MSHRIICRSFLFVSLSAVSGYAHAQMPSVRFEPVNYLGRMFGFGYSDGYSACKESRLESPRHNGAHSLASFSKGGAQLYDSPSVVNTMPTLNLRHSMQFTGSTLYGAPSGYGIGSECAECQQMPMQTMQAAPAPLHMLQPNIQQSFGPILSPVPLEQGILPEQSVPPLIRPQLENLQPIPQSEPVAPRRSPSDSLLDEEILGDELRYEELPEEVEGKSEPAMPLEDDSDDLLIPDEVRRWNSPNRHGVPSRMPYRPSQAAKPLNRYQR